MSAVRLQGTRDRGWWGHMCWNKGVARPAVNNPHRAVRRRCLESCRPDRASERPQGGHRSGLPRCSQGQPQQRACCSRLRHAQPRPPWLQHSSASGRACRATAGGPRARAVLAGVRAARRAGCGRTAIGAAAAVGAAAAGCGCRACGLRAAAVAASAGAQQGQ